MLPLHSVSPTATRAAPALFFSIAVLVLEESIQNVNKVTDLLDPPYTRTLCMYGLLIYGWGLEAQPFISRPRSCCVSAALLHGEFAAS